MAAGEGRNISLGAKHLEEMTVAGETVTSSPKAQIRILEWPDGTRGPRSRTSDHKVFMHLGQGEIEGRVLRGDMASLAMSTRPLGGGTNPHDINLECHRMPQNMWLECHRVLLNVKECCKMLWKVKECHRIS